MRKKPASSRLFRKLQTSPRCNSSVDKTRHVRQLAMHAPKKAMTSMGR